MNGPPISSDPFSATEHPTLNGCRYAVSVAGPADGPPVVLLHGWPETSRTWRLVVPALALRFRLFAPDWRGFGETEAIPPFTVEQLVEDLAALVDEIGRGPVHLVGHDWGAAAAYVLARRRPEKVRSLVTINMPVRRAVSWRLFHFNVFLQPVVPWLLLRLAGRWVVRRLIRLWAGRPEAFDEEIFRHYVEASRRPGAVRAALQLYRSTALGLLLRPFRKTWDTPGPGHRFEPLARPWLVLWGNRDFGSPPRNIEMFREDAPGVPVEIIEGAGHFPQEEAPAVVAERLHAWLQDVPPVLPHE